MKACTLITAFVLVLLLTSKSAAYSQNQTEYSIQARSDASASWTIKQTVTINQTYDDLDQFQAKVQILVEAAKNITSRDMFAEVTSMTSTVSGSYVSVEYKFNWASFCKVEDASIVIGDVFQVQDFFLQLYGEGKIQLTCPLTHTVDAVSPSPSRRDDSTQTLEWLGTIDFGNQDVRIVLRGSSASPGLIDALGQNVILIISLSVIVAGSFVAYYGFRRRNKRGSKTEETGVQISLTVESDEGKVVKMLKSSGGSVYQSAITEYFKFSRAKTSQLLTALEEKGIVRRYRKGRDKIVVIVDTKRGETR